MMTQKEDQDNVAPRLLFLIQALVNTQYGGRGRYAHSELTSPEHLRTWLITHDLIVDGTPVTEGDLRRVLLLREALRSLLQANNGAVVSAEQVDALNHLARNASLTVRFARDGQATLEPDIAGVDGAIASSRHRLHCHERWYLVEAQDLSQRLLSEGILRYLQESFQNVVFNGNMWESSQSESVSTATGGF